VTGREMSEWITFLPLHRDVRAADAEEENRASVKVAPCADDDIRAVLTLTAIIGRCLRLSKPDRSRCCVRRYRMSNSHYPMSITHLSEWRADNIRDLNNIRDLK
jgi:hypothetical protein